MMTKLEYLKTNAEGLFQECKRADCRAWTKGPSAAMFSLKDGIFTLPKEEADKYPHPIFFRADYYAKPEWRFPSELLYWDSIDTEKVHAFLRDDVNDAIREAELEEKLGHPIIHDCMTCYHNMYNCCGVGKDWLFRSEEDSLPDTFRCSDYREEDEEE